MKDMARIIGFTMLSVIGGVLAGEIIAWLLSGMNAVLFCTLAIVVGIVGGGLTISILNSNDDKSEAATQRKDPIVEANIESARKVPQPPDRVSNEIKAVKADIRALRLLEANVPRSFQRPLDRCLDAAESIVEACEGGDKGDWSHIRSAMIGTLEQILRAIESWKKLENHGQITGLQTRSVVKLLDAAEGIFVENKNALATRDVIEIATSLRLIDDEAKELSRQLAATAG